MFNIPYDDLIERVCNKTGKSKEEIEKMVKDKIKELSGLLTKEGAAHIVANDLGIELVEALDGRVKLESIVDGLRAVETIGRVSRVFELRSFTRKDGSEGKVLPFLIIDNTGSIRVVLWDDMAEKFSKIKEGNVVLIKNAMAKKNRNGQIELHLNKSSTLELNPNEDVELPYERQMSSKRKSISDISEEDSYVEIFGTIVNVFDIRFFEICPKCSKRVKQVGEAFFCDIHGEVKPEYNYVMNVIVDDGTGTIRVVFFSSQVNKLIGMDKEEIMKFKDNMEEFERVKQELIGKQIVVDGRVSKNEFFSRIELITNEINPNPDPEEETKRLESD